jgi:hypothetical protein
MGSFVWLNHMMPDHEYLKSGFNTGSDWCLILPKEARNGLSFLKSTYKPYSGKRTILNTSKEGGVGRSRVGSYKTPCQKKFYQNQSVRVFGAL